MPESRNAITYTKHKERQLSGLDSGLNLEYVKALKVQSINLVHRDASST